MNSRIKWKSSYRKIQLISAPNAYSLGKIKDSPVYSLASRPKEPKKYVTPAPGAYEVADTNHYKSKAPAFSLSTRYTVPSDHSMKPGPGTYTPEKVSALNRPHFDFQYHRDSCQHIPQARESVLEIRTR